MTAFRTLPQPKPLGKSAIGKTGVLVIRGFGIKVRVRAGHLEIEDGVGIERRQVRLARVGHALKRLVCISEDGFTTLSALNWLADIGASFTMLSRTGRVLFVTGPTASSDSRLRRSQGLALGNGVGVEISRALIDGKLQGQERVAWEGLHDPTTAGEIAKLRERLPAADSVEVIRRLEAHAAVSYFRAFRNVPVLWPKADLRKVPDHWHTVGNRHSPLSGGPRLAVTPVNAILNYCFALLESESRLALAALGLDPGMGLGLHTDTPNRDSLALDVLEPVRPQIESWLLNWIAREPLRRADFFETANGNCRLISHLCAKLSDTAPTWGKLVAPWAEYVARTLWATARSTSARHPVLASRLTQQHRREAKGQPSFALVNVPTPDAICRGCGVQLQPGRRFCSKCAAKATSENFDAGRRMAKSREHLAKRACTMVRHRRAIQSWNPGDLPPWLTRDFYRKQIQPALSNVAKSQIRSGLGVSEPYSSGIQKGKRIPHPRHWQVLAELVGVSSA